MLESLRQPRKVALEGGAQRARVRVEHHHRRAPRQRAEELVGARGARRRLRRGSGRAARVSRPLQQSGPQRTRPSPDGPSPPRGVHTHPCRAAQHAAKPLRRASREGAVGAPFGGGRPRWRRFGARPRSPARRPGGRPPPAAAAVPTPPLRKAPAPTLALRRGVARARDRRPVRRARAARGARRRRAHLRGGRGRAAQARRQRQRQRERERQQRRQRGQRAAARALRHGGAGR